MHDGHFDYGNGYHGRVYLNPHQLFGSRRRSGGWRRICSTSCRPSCSSDRSRGRPGHRRRAARAHDGGPARRPPRADASGRAASRRSRQRGRVRPARASTRGRWPAGACSWPTTCGIRGRRSSAAPSSCASAGGTVLATVEICDRLEAVADAGVPNFALAEYPAPDNYAAAECPMCRAGEPITAF